MDEMEKRTFKDEAYAGIAGIAKAFSTAGRLEIIDLLANGEKTVEQVAVQTNLSVANASRHLQILKRAHLVKRRREGNYIYYRLNGRRAYAVWQALRTLGLEEEPAMVHLIRQFREGMGSEEAVVYRNLPRRADFCLLDVRPQEEYEAGHLPGALSVPISELEEHLEELPKDKIIITYCRGSFCTYADEAVRLLRNSGFEALRLEENIMDVNETNRVK